MRAIPYYYRFIIAPLFASLMLAGCAPRALAANNIGGGLTETPSADPAIMQFGPMRIYVLEPEMFLYDISAGGVSEFREDWSGIASWQAARSAALALVRAGHSPLIFPQLGPARDMFILKTRMRYHASAFQSDFFAQQGFAPADDEEAVYSVGSLEAVSDHYGVDGFLYIYGFEEKFSPQRWQILAAKAEKAARAQSVPGERTFAAAVLAERSGRILWYKHLLFHGNLDMRSERHAARMIGALFE